MSSFLLLVYLLITPVAAQEQPSTPQVAPDFTIGDTSLVELSQQQVIYLDFWASWCGPCREAFPFMNQLHAEKGSLGLKIIAVNVDADNKNANRFLTQHPANFTIIYDPEMELLDRYQVMGIPTSYLIADGKIVAKYIGFDQNRINKKKSLITVLLAQLPKNKNNDINTKANTTNQ